MLRKSLKFRRPSVLLLLLGLTLACRMPPSAEDDTALLAYVANAGANHVQVIDVETGETLRRIYAGTTPWRLVPAPGGKELWVQHWLSETTAVIDLETHEVRATVPARGPGLFDATGERFLSFSWPGSGLTSFDAASGAVLETRVTEVSRVYNLALGESGEDLFMVQHIPTSEGQGDRYAYLVSFPLAAEHPVPGSVRTGTGPLDVVVVPGQPFVVTADSGAGTLTLLNVNGDGRTVPTCPWPRRVLLSADTTRLVALCWDESAGRYGDVIVYRADFNARPWPELEEEVNARLEGAPVAGALAPDGAVWVLDRTGRRLLELDPATLEPRRQVAAGEVPADVVLIEVPRAWRDALAAGESPSRRRLEEVVAHLREAGAPFAALRWQETISWRQPVPPAEGEEDVVPKYETHHRELEMALAAPDRFRRQATEGALSLSAGGVSLTVRDDGRFWPAPRQELVSRLVSLPNFEPEEAIRRLAGDVPGSPFLAGGLAVDLVAEVEEDDRRYVLIGALEPGQLVAQLWVDAETWRPTTLIEKFPAAPGQAHQAGSPGAFVETKLLDFQTLEGGVFLPSRIERVLDGQWVQEVSLEDAEVVAQPAEADFDPARLGGLVVPEVEAVATTEDGEPGRAVPVLEHDFLDSPWAPHPPYNSNPPTSGPRLRDLADWGVHDVPVPALLQVHNLEHGGVALQYGCAEPCPELAAELERIARPWGRVIVAPWPFMDARVALTAWGRIELLDEVDEDRIVAFLEAWEGKHQH